MRDNVEDIDDFVPEKSVIVCPSCKNDEEKKVKCYLCKGKGFLFAREDCSQWIEDG
jgi:hypothetical protein